MEQAKRSLNFLLSELNEHKNELAGGNVNGIMDHVSGYKLLKEYSLVC